MHVFINLNVLQNAGCVEFLRDSTTGQFGYLSYRTSSEIVRFSSIDPDKIIDDDRYDTKYKSSYYPDLDEPVEDTYWFSNHLYCILGKMKYFYMYKYVCI